MNEAKKPSTDTAPTGVAAPPPPSIFHAIIATFTRLLTPSRSKAPSANDDPIVIRSTNSRRTLEDSVQQRYHIGRLMAEKHSEEGKETIIHDVKSSPSTIPNKGDEDLFETCLAERADTVKEALHHVVEEVIGSDGIEHESVPSLLSSSSRSSKVLEDIGELAYVGEDEAEVEKGLEERANHVKEYLHLVANEVVGPHTDPTS
ncbi:hypothetical protein SeMB42_g06636 [Synchytrium endobioticum]|uniref:Uncharacterized protein n=1 Tax=Synchytrium endobioticum TaxID=286115 RepID=A0A507CQA5_9FUNG|nr:hypothetical protein SeMB42_g06636 [Synchytrium endobioticum]TPX41326.1 hypothetical protein SeLEV6574_g06159 [Synchytrium endobioticum]